MMQFSNQQLEALRNGMPIRLSEAGTDVVVLRADLFERLRNQAYDDSPWTDEEMDLLAHEDVDALGWDGMEVYQEMPQ